MPITPTLTIIHGDDITLSITWQTTSGSAVDITGSEMFFSVKAKPTDPDSSALIQKAWFPVTGGGYTTTQGQTYVLLSHIDTAITPGIYYWDIQMKATGGNITSTQYSTLEIVQDITTRTS